MGNMHLEEGLAQSVSGEYSRKVWRLEADPTLPTWIFLDAEFYLDRMDAARTICEMQASGNLPFANCLFVSNQSPEARHYDYTCNDRYAHFIAKELLPTHSTANNLICGLSLSGLQSAYIALSYPDLFLGALCQSGSFWWEDEKFTLAASKLTATGRFWLSVGDRESEAGVSHPPTGLRQSVSQLESVAKAALGLQSIGCTVRHNVYRGDHETSPWKEELPEALSWLTVS